MLEQCGANVQAAAQGAVTQCGRLKWLSGACVACDACRVSRWMLGGRVLEVSELCLLHLCSERSGTEMGWDSSVWSERWIFIVSILVPKFVGPPASQSRVSLVNEPFRTPTFPSPSAPCWHGLRPFFRCIPAMRGQAILTWQHAMIGQDIVGSLNQRLQDCMDGCGCVRPIYPKICRIQTALRESKQIKRFLSRRTILELKRQKRILRAETNRQSTQPLAVNLNGMLRYGGFFRLHQSYLQHVLLNTRETRDVGGQPFGAVAVGTCSDM